MQSCMLTQVVCIPTSYGYCSLSLILITIPIIVNKQEKEREQL